MSEELEIFIQSCSDERISELYEATGGDNVLALKSCITQFITQLIR